MILTTVVRFAIRFRGVIIALASLVAGYGLFTLPDVRLDVFPEFAPPQVIIQTEAPGLSAEQTETLVTQSLENALQGVTGLATMRSNSAQGLSMVTLTFHDSTDIYRDRQAVAERLSGVAANLPTSVKPPAMLPLTSATSVVLTAGLTSDNRSPMALRTLADWTVKPALLGVPGVAGVSVFGGAARQLQIQVIPARLVRYGLSLQDVVAAARKATAVRGAGFITTANQRIVLNTHGQVRSAAQLANIVLRRKNGANLRLGDVAHVSAAAAPAVGAASIMGKPGVMLVVEEQYGADTMMVTHRLERALNQLKPALDAEQVRLYPDLFRPANFIETAIGHLRQALLAGAMLVVVVLFLFLFNARTAFISALAIPLSLLTAVIVLNHFGVGLNTMTLGGLAIALGEVVDDAIIDVENIFRRLRENRLLTRPRPPLRVVLDASIEVRSAVVYATLIVALVFVPVLTFSGVTGKLFAPLGIAYIAAILASLLVALTLTPALAYVLLKQTAAEAPEPPLIRWLKTRYERLLGRVQRRSAAIVAVVALLCVGALAVIPFFEGSFLPALREGHYIIHMRAIPGTSLTQSLALGRHVTLAVSRIAGVRSVAQRVGRAEKVSDPAGSFSSEFEVDLDPLSGRGQQRVLKAIRAALTGFVGADFSVNTFLTERIHETLSGQTAPVVVNIYGHDLNVLDRKAAQVAAVLGGIPGAKGVQIQAPQGSPHLAIRLRQRSLARFGIAPDDALAAIQTAYEGTTVAQTYEGNKVFDVTVVLDPKQRRDPALIGSLPLRDGDGTVIRLSEIADIHQSAGRFSIIHNDAQRVQTVTAQVSASALNRVVAQAKRRIRADITFPHGTYVVFAGDAAARAQALRDLLMHAGLAAGGIVLLLFMALGSVRPSVLVLVNLPFALVGGVAIVLITGGELSIGALVGFVTLFGITLRNAIMLISHYQHLVQVERLPWGPATAVRGASERLAPILMTALVTALGLFPLAITSGAPGNEIEGPMALVILGGLVTSTILNLLVLPALALRYGHFERYTYLHEQPPAPLSGAGA